MNSPNYGWLKHFFSGRNTLKWNDISTGTASDGWTEDILPWIRIAESGEPDYRVILPCLDDDGKTIWYAFSNGALGNQRLSQELQAFIGPSYSDYNGQPSTLDPTDQVEGAVKEGSTDTVFKFSPTDPSQIPKIRRAIRLYSCIIKRYKAPIERSLQPFAIIRAEFDRALLAGDEDEARRKYDQLIHTGRLSPDNRLFLEVRLLAGLGRWPQIAGDARLLRSLNDLILPRRVLADVIEALYKVHIEPVESSTDAQQALRTFKEAGIDRYARLFATRRGLILPQVVKSFFLYELCRSSPNTKRLQELIKLLDDKAEDQFAVNLMGLIPTSPAIERIEQDQLHYADLTFEDLDFERALELYIKLPPSVKRLRRMLFCAKVIGDREIAQNVLSVLDQQQKSDLGALSQSEQNALDYLRNLVSLPSIPGKDRIDKDPREGWLQWANWVTSGADATEAVEILQELAVSWDTSALANSASQVKEFSDLIGNSEGAAAEVFRYAYPLIYEGFVLGYVQPVRSFKPLLTTLLTNSVLLDVPSPVELELVRQLASSLMTIGLSTEEYNELVSDLVELLGEQASLSILDWAFDVAEVLAIHTCPSTDSRLRYFMKILNLVRRVSHRISSAHRKAVELLCLDLEIERPVELIETGREDESESVNQFLANRKIAIYTLAEQAGQRAAKMLKQLCPEVSVDINSDEVCTERLIALAKHADIFVFAWKSSKHQAYYCVKNHRPEGLPLLHPLGKGSSSILREIFETPVLG